MRLVAYLLAMLASGCITYDPRQPVPVVDQGPAWLSAAFERAQTFWQGHGVTVERQDHGIRLMVGLRYNPQPMDYAPGARDAGQYWYDDSTLRVAEWLEPRANQASCVIAHEIGHAIDMGGGMNVHTSPGSLMTGDGRVTMGETCYWSTEDQQALDRLRNR